MPVPFNVNISSGSDSMTSTDSTDPCRVTTGLYRGGFHLAIDDALHLTSLGSSK